MVIISIQQKEFNKNKTQNVGKLNRRKKLQIFIDDINNHKEN